MKLSLIIPTMGRPDDLERMLDSVSRQTRKPDEVIVVDQSRDGLTKARVDAFIEKGGIGTVVYYQQEEPSSARARNKGFGLSTGDIVSFSDDDVVLDPAYFEHVCNHFASDWQLGGVSGNVKVTDPPKGRKWAVRQALMRFFLISFFDGRMTASGFGYPIFLFEVEDVTEVELFPGYSMNFRRKCLERHSFDEWFTGYSFREDVDLSYRISREARLIVVPEARFEHHYADEGRPQGAAFKRMQFRNYWHVFNKNKNRSLLDRILFGYSVTGLVLIDTIEWIWGFKKQKWESLAMDWSAVFGLVRGNL